MNKKMLLLGSAMLNTIAAAAPPSGFYVGLESGVKFARIKLKDKTVHRGIETKVKTESNVWYAHFKDMNYILAGSDLPPAVREANKTVNLKVRPVQDTEEEHETLSTYKIKPHLKLFMGFNYSLGSLVLGGELRIGTTLGTYSHEGRGEMNVPKSYEIKNNEICVDSSDTYYKELCGVQTTVKLGSPLTFDAVARIGWIIPGSGGRLLASVSGGVGFEKMKIEVTQDSKNVYIKSILQSALRDLNSKYNDLYQKIENLSAGLFMSDDLHDPKDQKLLSDFLSVSHVYQALQNAFEFDSLRDGSHIFYEEHADKNDFAAATLFANIRTGDDLSKEALDLMKNVAPPKSDKICFSYNLGTQFEYYFESGMFVRLNYTFKDILTNRLKTEETYPVASLDRKSLLARGTTIIKDDKVRFRVETILENHTSAGDRVALFKKGKETDQAMENIEKRWLGAEFFGGLPEKVALGQVEASFGVGKHTFVNEFGIGLGYKF
ncbi:hypothetical protein AGMMS49949_01050 [Alphaproteobacteria bacterium]|nr:hypothetical protein AGMMS49949_01050 [Alphaproteobacteria bacterium]